VRILFHVAHGVIIGAGAIAVIFVLIPGRRRLQRPMARLRKAATSDELIRLAEERAAAELGHPTLTGAIPTQGEGG
jgi:hypothetical protein